MRKAGEEVEVSGFVEPTKVQRIIGGLLAIFWGAVSKVTPDWWLLRKGGIRKRIAVRVYADYWFWYERWSGRI